MNRLKQSMFNNLLTHARTKTINVQQHLSVKTIQGHIERITGTSKEFKGTSKEEMFNNRFMNRLNQSKSNIFSHETMNVQ